MQESTSSPQKSAEGFRGVMNIRNIKSVIRKLGISAVNSIFHIPYSIFQLRLLNGGMVL